MRRNHSPQSKAKVPQTALRGEHALGELAEQFDVHPNQTARWTQRATENTTVSFDKDGAGEIANADRKDLL